MARFSPTIALALVLIAFAASVSFAQLPPCDYSRSVSVGSSHFEICAWHKADADGVSLLQIAAVTDGKMVDLAKFDIFGAITNLGVTDLDGDKNPEIHILVESPDSGHYPELYLLELAEGQLDACSLPEMTRLLANGYMGHDTFAFEKDRVVRSFPIYDGNSKDAQPTGGTRRLTYILSENQLALQSRLDSRPEPVDDSTKQ